MCVNLPQPATIMSYAFFLLQNLCWTLKPNSFSSLSILLYPFQMQKSKKDVPTITGHKQVRISLDTNPLHVTLDYLNDLWNSYIQRIVICEIFECIRKTLTAYIKLIS